MNSIARAEAVAVGFSGRAALDEYTRMMLAAADEEPQVEHPAQIAENLGIPQST